MMMSSGIFVVLVVVVAAAMVFAVTAQVRSHRNRVEGRRIELLDARVDAERWIHRLSDEILLVNPTDDAVQRLTGLASQRHASALRQIGAAQTVAQVRVARDVAIEGLYYMRDAQGRMGA